MAINTIENGQYSYNSMSDFSKIVPENEGIERLVENVIRNRTTVLSRAEEFGLNAEFLFEQGSDIAVGPFVYPTPISTTYAGKSDNARISLETTATIAEKLTTSGYPATPYTVLSLAITEMPTKGLEDSLILPKTKDTNQKIRLTKSQQRMAYSSVSISATDIERVCQNVESALVPYAEKYWQLRKGWRGKVISQSVVEDLIAAFTSQTTDQTSDVVCYMDFANAFNAILTEKVSAESIPCFTCIDTAYYSPFMKSGIDDIGRFIGKISDVGFFDQDPNFIKVVDNSGRTTMLKFLELQGNDALLQFTIDGETIQYSELVNQDVDISPCKELSYLLCFTSIIPVVYGSQNNGGDYYAPYALARNQGIKLGFLPELYRVQPPISSQYDEMNTVFDFYRELLLPDILEEK